MLAKFAYDLQDLLALSRPRHTCDRHFFLLPLTKNSGHSQLPPSSNTHTAYSKPARLARYAKTEQPTLSSPTATTTQSEAQIVWRDTQRIAPKPFYAVRQKRSFHLIRDFVNTASRHTLRSHDFQRKRDVWRRAYRLRCVHPELTLPRR